MIFRKNDNTSMRVTRGNSCALSHQVPTGSRLSRSHITSGSRRPTNLGKSNKNVFSRNLGRFDGEMLEDFESILESLRSGSKIILAVSDAHAKVIMVMKDSSLLSVSVGLQVRNQQGVSEQVCDNFWFSSYKSQRGVR